MHGAAAGVWEGGRGKERVGNSSTGKPNAESLDAVHRCQRTLTAPEAGCVCLPVGVRSAQQWASLFRL